MENKYVTIEEVISLPRFEEVSITEDGKYISYVKRTADWEENAYRSHVWVYESGSKNQYPISTGENESSNPAWSPVKNYLAYIAEYGEKTCQVFLKTFDDLNGLKLTNSAEGVNSFKWAPDGKGVFYTASEPDSEELKNRKEVYGDIRYHEREYKNNSLYYIDLSKAKNSCSKDESIQITNPKDFNVRGFDVSADGSKIVLVITPTSDITDDDTEVCILNLEDKSIVKLDINAYISRNILFSPDGSKILYSRSPKEKGYYRFKVEEYMVLEIYDLKTQQVLRNLSEMDKNVIAIRWTNNGILATWQDKANMRVGMISENGDVRVITNDDICYSEDAFITQNDENIAYIKTVPEKSTEIYLNHKKITNESKVYENKLLSNKELITWKTRDGLQIEGVLSTPRDFDNTKRYPLLLVIHGGPARASFPIHNMQINYPIEQFIEKGYIVLEPNYRGSSGYGNKFLTANFRMLGIGDYEDVISGVDMLIEKGIADKARVGVMGWSQGGYISAFCSTYSNRFKAISVGAGISDWVTYYVNTDITSFALSYLGNTPWNDPEIYAKASPMTYIKSSCTPTLIQHGDKDGRVPFPNAMELYRGLKDMGVETELVVYKGMGHAVNRPGLHKAVMEQNLEWFTKRV